MTQLPFHGGQLRQIAERFGIPASQLIDFSANINPEGPPPSVLAKLTASLKDPATLTVYPDVDLFELKHAIATYAGVNTSNVSVANGFVPLLEAVLRALSVDHCLLPVPSFVEYAPALDRVKIKITTQTLSPGNNFNYDIEGMLNGNHDAILLANPQNPSGALCDAQSLVRLVDSAARRNVVVLLDEAFIDYQPASSLTEVVDDLPNLVVFRSVTKFHGIPGMRVAYLLSSTDHARSIDACLPPWPVTIMAAQAAIAAVADESYADRTRSLNRQRRDILRSGLTALGVYVYPSEANYLLFRLPAPELHRELYLRMILGHHIVLRDCSNYQSLAAGHFRVAVRTPEDNELLLQALADTLSTL